MSNVGYSNGGSAPYGYQRVAVDLKTGSERILRDGQWRTRGQEKVKWVLGDQAEIGTVRRIYRERAGGKACVLIARQLNDDGIPCPKRGRWRNRDGKWSAITVKAIIENPTYRGAWVYNRNSMSRIRARLRHAGLKNGIAYPHWQNPSLAWVVVEDKNPAIVSRDLWERANHVDDRSPVARRNGHTIGSQYLLTGLIRCGDCGHAFQGWSGRSKGRPYYKYVDGGWVNKRVCSHLGLDKDRLEELALQAVRESLADPELADILTRMAEDLQQHGYPDRAAEREAIHRELVKNRKMARNLAEEMAEGNRSAAVRDRLSELETEVSKIEAELHRLQRIKDPAATAEEIKASVAGFVLEFERQFALAPVEERKLLLKKCISAIVVDRGRRVVDIHVRRIPAVHPELVEVMKNKRAPTEVVSARSSGDRT